MLRNINNAELVCKKLWSVCSTRPAENYPHMYQHTCSEMLEGLVSAISDLDNDMLETASMLADRAYSECMIGLMRLDITLYVAVANIRGLAVTVDGESTPSGRFVDYDTIY